MADTFMHIPNDDTQNYPLSRLQLLAKTQLNEPTNENLIKVPKVVKSTNKKTDYKLWGLVK